MLLLLVFAGCSSNSSLTSSFGSRKYTKGYFFDNPAKVEAKAREEVLAKAKKQIEPEALEDTKLANIIMLTKTNELTYKNKSIVKQVLKEYKKQILALAKTPDVQENSSRITDQIDQTKDEPSTANKQQLTTAKVLIAGGMLLILLTIIVGALVAVQAFPVWLLILVAISLLVMGITFYIDSLKNTNPSAVIPEKPLSNDFHADNPQAIKATNYGGVSLGLAIFGTLLSLLFGFTTAVAAALGVTAISAAIVMGIPAVILIVALVLGIIGRNSSGEKHPGGALAGIIISAIMLALVGTAIYSILLL